MLHLYLCSLEVCLSQTLEANWKNMLPQKSILELNVNQRFSGTELLFGKFFTCVLDTFNHLSCSWSIF